MRTRSAHLARWAGPGHLVGLVAALAYSWWAAATAPFTIGADVATAIPLVAVTAVAGGQWWSARRHATLPSALRRLDRPERAGAWWPVPSALVALVGWELYNFFSAPRVTHPTISSLYDAASRSHAWKATFFLAWLALGWELVRR